MGCSMLKPPVRRIGGKYFLRNWLVGMVPEHVCYVEPFCGAGHLLFGKTPSQVEVVNDIDGHLISFFKIIKDHDKRQKLIETLEYMPYSRSLWQEIRTNWKQENIPGDPVEASACWFFLNRACFGGDQLRGGFAAPSTTGRNPAQSFRNAIDTFDDIARRLRSVTIECLDYKDCILRYDSTETLFYVDSPYYGSEHYYGNSFSRDDHSILADMLHNIKGKVMVSHYASELHDSLYAGWHRFGYQSFKGSYKAGVGEGKPKTVEVLYCNFESE